MRFTGLLLSVLLLAAGCVASTPGGQEGGAGDSADLDDPSLDDGLDGVGDDDDEQEQEQEQPDEPEGDDDEDDEPLGWDPTPPAEVGVRVEGVVSCGWLQGPSRVGFEFDGETWSQYQTEGNSQIRPELYPCTLAAMEHEKELLWGDDGLLYFEAGGLEHDLWPTDTELRWLGEVGPIGGPDEECQRALEEAGVSSPMMMSYTIDVITYPG